MAIDFRKRTRQDAAEQSGDGSEPKKQKARASTASAREKTVTAREKAPAAHEKTAQRNVPPNNASAEKKAEKGTGGKGSTRTGRRGSDGRDTAAEKAAVQRTAATERAAKPGGKGNGKHRGSSGAPDGTLEVIPIGGLGEIGKNMTAFRCNGEIMLVDCGMSFPEDGMFGIDIVIPEFDFLEQNADQVRGLIVTHGHEDHIGAVPYLLKKLRLPVYGTRLTLGLIEHKLSEHGLKGDLRQIKAGDKVKIGKFTIETIRATHSIADSLSLAIETPDFRIFHTGDFKIDYTPIDGDPMDFQKLAEIGRKGIDLMLCDSTNALRDGFTQSEKTMGPILDKIFADTNGRIIIATFASNVHRVQTIINTAVKHKRKVALSGRSMLNVQELADGLGYLNIPTGVMVELEEIRNIPDKKLVLITTGSQGEPMSALARMASGEHRSVKIRRGDKVILSSSPIPGNEKTVSGIVNSLLGLGAEVIYSDIADIHVSGHASREEIKIMISLLKPKYFMPVHGENKHLLQNASIAENLGIARNHILIGKNGCVVEMRDGEARMTDRHVPAEPVFVDGLGVGDIGTIVLKDRRLLSESGLIIVVATIDSASGQLSSGPDVISRGFVYEKQSGDIIEEVRQKAVEVINGFGKGNSTDWDSMKGAIRNQLKGFIYERTKRSPVILTILMEA